MSVNSIYTDFPLFSVESSQLVSILTEARLFPRRVVRTRMDARGVAMAAAHIVAAQILNNMLGTLVLSWWGQNQSASGSGVNAAEQGNLFLTLV